MMPKGVEHTLQAGDWSRLWPVPTSVMPKGVEHIDCADHREPGVDVCLPL